VLAVASSACSQGTAGRQNSSWEVELCMHTAGLLCHALHRVV
jgi:hypothetical protein